MASPPLQRLTVTVVILASLLLGCTEKVSGMRYIPNSSNTTEIKYSDFLVDIVPQPSGLITGLGRFLLPPKHKKPFNFYKAPLAEAPTTSYSGLAPNSGYEALSPSYRKDQIPPVPQP